MFKQIAETILPHWPLIAAPLVLGLIGIVAKRTIWTKGAAQKWRRIGRHTLPLHPVAAGIAAALLFPSLPASPGVKAGAPLALYYALCGVLSVFAFDVIDQLAKARGIKLNLATDPEEQETPASE